MAYLARAAAVILLLSGGASALLAARPPSSPRTIARNSERARAAVHPLIAERFSPRAFSRAPVAAWKVESVLAAARLTASSYNSQPWHFVVLDRVRDQAGYDRLYQQIGEYNRGWLDRRPPVLIVALGRQENDRGQPLAHSDYDVGQAVATLTLQAQHLGLGVHQMAGFDAAGAAQELGVPQGFKPLTVLALGHVASPRVLANAELRGREQRRRATPTGLQRKSLGELVSRGRFGNP
jgi:nitroreductase